MLKSHPQTEQNVCLMARTKLKRIWKHNSDIFDRILDGVRPIDAEQGGP